MVSVRSKKPLEKKKKRANYSDLELKLIDNCVRRSGSLRELALQLKRDYCALWRFARRRGGAAERTKRARAKTRTDNRIRATHTELFRRRKERSTTATEVARAAGTHRRRVTAVLGAALQQRKLAGHAGNRPRLKTFDWFSPFFTGF
jgi:hypothetical protein